MFQRFLVRNRRHNPFPHLLAGGLLLTVWMISSARGAVTTWGAGKSGNWSDQTKWAGNQKPANGDDVRFWGNGDDCLLDANQANPFVNSVDISADILQGNPPLLTIDATKSLHSMWDVVLGSPNGSTPRVGNLTQFGGVTIDHNLRIGRSDLGNDSTYLLSVTNTAQQTLDIMLGGLYVGDGGKGVFTHVSGQANVNGVTGDGVTGLIVGNNGASGIYNMQGGGLHVTHDMILGNSGAQKNGALSQTGGEISVGGLLTVGKVGNGSGSITLAAGKITAGSGLNVSDGGSGGVTQTGGEMIITTGDANVSYSGANGIYTLQGGQVNIPCGNLNVGNAAGLLGTFQQQGGTVNVTVNPNAVLVTGVCVGVAGESMGRYEQTGGTLNVRSPNGGVAGIYVGSTPGIKGLVGAGTFISNGTINANSMSVGDGGNGVYLQQNGVVTIDNWLDIGHIFGNNEGGGLYQMSGGSQLDARHLSVFEKGTFQQLSGLCNIKSGNIHSGGTYSIRGDQGGATLTQTDKTDGFEVGGKLNVMNGAVVTLKGFLTVDEPAAGAGPSVVIGGEGSVLHVFGKVNKDAVPPPTGKGWIKEEPGGHFDPQGPISWLNWDVEGSSYAAIGGSDPVDYDDVTVTNAGTMTFVGTADMTAMNGTTITNTSGGVFDFQSDASILSGNGTASTFNMSGGAILRKSAGTGTTRCGWTSPSGPRPCWAGPHRASGVPPEPLRAVSPLFLNRRVWACCCWAGC